MLAAYLAALPATLVLMGVVWLLSLSRRNVAIVDVFWGPGIAAAGLAWWWAAVTPGPRGTLAIVLAAVWAIRLATHIGWRSRGKPEDRRYREIRARNEPNFALKSLWLVFGLQAVLAWLIAAPLFGAVAGNGPLGPLDLFGTLLFVIGFGFEAIADWQMARFQARAAEDNAVMDQGLWRYSRHPNYFGETLLWWGLWLIAVAGDAWWTAFGPALLTFLLLKVSGVALTEKSIATRRPAYEDYVRRTSAFLPAPPRA
jgi:steroid 5-alpha reductase family enzyme